MGIETIIGLGFIGTAAICALINGAYSVGLFDAIAVRICNYIVTRMERIERGDI